MPRERIPTTEDFSVNVQITIHPSSSGYTAFISAEESQWYRFPIELTQDELKAINSELQQAIEDVSGCFDEIDGPDDRDALACLASKGKFAFNKIFQKGLPREIISSALKASATIQFVSESFFIPWELLYDSPLGAEVDVSYFWGMRHIVSRRLIRNARPGDLEMPYRILCNGKFQKSQEARSGLGLASPHRTSLHNNRYVVILRGS